jgi:hypothetical protein
VTVLDPDPTGRVDPGALEAALTDGTVLVSLMAANNEVGTLNPVGELAALCAARGVAFHTDAAQAFGKVPLDVASGVALVSISAHKLYGPKGVGALRVRNRPRVPLAPIVLRRGARAGPAVGDAERAGDRRPRRGRDPPGAAGEGRGGAAPGRPARPARRGDPRRPRRRHPQRSRRRPAPREPQPLVRGRRRRAARRVASRRGGLLRVGVHDGLGRAEPRPAGARRPGRPREGDAPLRPRALHDAGRGGLRGGAVVAAVGRLRAEKESLRG